jgi:hypothetical protein
MATPGKSRGRDLRAWLRARVPEPLGGDGHASQQPATLSRALADVNRRVASTTADAMPG